MLWKYIPVDEKKVTALSRKLGVSKIIASSLVRLGISEAANAEQFLHPKLQYLDDPFRLLNLREGVARLRRAMETRESILIIGDYDVDGITSTVFLVSILKRFGIYPRYLVPLRLEEGYGLSRSAIDRALEGGRPDLLIALDCGTNSKEEVAYLRSLGIDVIIIDHHTSKEHLPEDCLLINPHVFNESGEPWIHLCTVGLVFKFVHGILKALRDEGDDFAFKIQLKEYLDLVALGTIADLVPLRNENRILAQIGLKHLARTKRMGLTALFEVSGMKYGEKVSPFDVAFKLGPRINASGRLADAAVPIDLLLSGDWTTCSRTARQLNEFNRERQEIERAIFREAEDRVNKLYRDRAGIVLFDPEWHPGVVGIVASRIIQKFHRPCIVLGSEGEFARGSGRSISGINLVEVLDPCDDLLAHWGGHPMAVGVSLNPDNLEVFREKFHQSIKKHSGEKLPEPELKISHWIKVKEITENLLNDLEILHPFGQGNHEPVFGIKGHVLRSSIEVFGQNHFRFQMETLPGTRVNGVAWKQADRIPPTTQKLDLAVKLNWNRWNGRKYPQIILVDWKLSK